MDAFDIKIANYVAEVSPETLKLVLRCWEKNLENPVRISYVRAKN
jgi:hypothetical protein